MRASLVKRVRASGGSKQGGVLVKRIEVGDNGCLPALGVGRGRTVH